MTDIEKFANSFELLGKSIIESLNQISTSKNDIEDCLDKIAHTVNEAVSGVTNKTLGTKSAPKYNDVLLQTIADLSAFIERTKEILATVDSVNYCLLKESGLQLHNILLNNFPSITLWVLERQECPVMTGSTLSNQN